MSGPVLVMIGRALGAPDAKTVALERPPRAAQ
jgi:hypothetical protein